MLIRTKYLNYTFSLTPIKVVRLKTGHSVILVFNYLNLYITLGTQSLNEKLIKLNIIKSVSYKKPDYSLATSNGIKESEFINYFAYPSILKFKLVGRHFKLRKKKKNFLYCSLNYSHKSFIMNNTVLSYLKFKLKKGRLLYLSLTLFNNSSHLRPLFQKLRELNVYTHKGVRNMSVVKFKRKGKSPSI